VAAALELGARAERLRWQGRGPPLPASRAVDTWARPRLGGLAHEELWALALDGRQRMRAARMVARGGLAGLHVAPRDVLRVMLREGAHGFVLVHNHPSGDPTPSLEDVRFTRSVEGLAAALGLPLLDHVVVAHAGYVSLLDAGLLASARPPSQGTPARAGEEPERLTVSGQ
jgi:DNA repair protein RadC